MVERNVRRQEGIKTGQPLHQAKDTGLRAILVDVQKIIQGAMHIQTYGMDVRPHLPKKDQ